jgi:leader peptidase (prepilin peptidase)/N-methyltransferase
MSSSLDALPIGLVRAFAFVFGAVWGSFANVVIYRWPRDESLVRPGSHCTACGKPVSVYDNIPIVSWFVLRGRCRRCRAKFSFRYPMVEAVFGVVALALADRIFRSGASITLGIALAHWAVRFTVAFVLIVATFIDLDEMLVPWWVKWCALVPLGAAIVLRPLGPSVSLLDAVVGAGVGYVGLRLLFIDGYKLLTGRAGMGLGDAEILLVVGALLGIRGVLFALGAGAVQGVIATGIVKLVSVVSPRAAEPAAERASLEPAGESDPPDEDRGRGLKTKVAFVPFLALGALEYMLGADRIVESYLRAMTG